MISETNKPLDMVLLPEFFSTGISHKGFLELNEEENASPALDFIAFLSKKYNTNILAGTIIEKEGDRLYNTSYIINRSGKIEAKYRKNHLFNYFGGNEGAVITKGECITLAELDFAKIGMSICFDIRFPIHFNKLIKAGAEIIVCPNAWCAPKKEPEIAKIRKEELRAFMIARGSENLVYFAGSSLQGNLGDGLIGAGNSIIVSPFGEVLAFANKQNEGIYAEIDLEIVRKLKAEFPVYNIN
ncbi:MAG: hypothetical protein LUG16_07985 [Candidatus Gastranaerophilales bacterium]|nr:hypothetical protein [Candidatus Gastranaerophilales bacterium]